jgi:hypothetical protein
MNSGRNSGNEKRYGAFRWSFFPGLMDGMVKSHFSGKAEWSGIGIEGLHRRSEEGTV